MATYQEILTDNVSGATNTFTTTYTPKQHTLTVYVEGIFQAPNLYTNSQKTIVFPDQIPQNYVVTVAYDYEPGEAIQEKVTPQIHYGGNMCITKASTLVTGATSTSKFLLVDVNGKNVGIPLFKFSYSDPEIDLVVPYTDFVVKNPTFVEGATEYGAGVVFNWYESLSAGSSAIDTTYAIPIWKVNTNSNIIPSIKINNPTIGGKALIYTGEFLVASIDNEAYGIPLANYESIYPFASTVDPNAVKPTTVFNTSRTLYDAPRGAGSTNLNSKIKTYAQLIDRIKKQMGYPVVNIEICDDSQIVDFIDIAMEWYTKYAGYTEEFLIFNSELYSEPGLQIDRLFSIAPSMRSSTSCGMSGSWDYDLDAYRKVAGIFSFEPGESTGINTLFTLEQAMAQQTYFSYMLGNVGFDLVTWEVLKQWLDLRTKVLAQTHYVDFDENRQLLRLIPAPNRYSRFYGVIGAWVEKPIAHLLREQWIQKYALALTKIAVGNVRGKYQGMQMFGGGTINYNDLLSQGLKEKDELEKSLQEGEWYDTAPPRFFLG